MRTKNNACAHKQRDTPNHACACTCACACGYICWHRACGCICWHEICFLMSRVFACTHQCLHADLYTQKDHVHAQRHPQSHLMNAHLLSCIAKPACMHAKTQLLLCMPHGVCMRMPVPHSFQIAFAIVGMWCELHACNIFRQRQEEDDHQTLYSIKTSHVR